MAGTGWWLKVLPEDSVYMIWLNAASEAAYAANGSDVVYTTPFYVAGMGSGGAWAALTSPTRGVPWCLQQHNDW